MKANRVLVVFDVFDDGRRGALTKLLKAHLGHRQRSVFEGHIPEEAERELISDAEKVLDAGKDSMILFRICERCVAHRRVIGQETGEDVDVGYYIV